MKRLLRSWVFWAFAVPGALVGAAVLLHVEAIAFDCLCDSRKSTRRLYVGVGARIHPVGSFDWESPSAFHKDILGARHAHRWSSTGSSMTSLGPLGRVSCGMSHSACLADYYDRTPAFQGWLKARLASGEIDAAAIDLELTRNKYYAKGEHPFGWTPP